VDFRPIVPIAAILNCDPILTKVGRDILPDIQPVRLVDIYLY